MGRKKKRKVGRPKKAPKTEDQEETGPATKVVILEEIDLTDSDNDNNVCQSNKQEERDKQQAPAVPTTTTPAVNITEGDPKLISLLVKHHCLFCLSPKSRNIFSIHSSCTKMEETDGYELLRRYFGVRTADCLNDIYDAYVFTNKALLTAEFPAPLLCEKCVNIVGELDRLHGKLEGIQRGILRRVQKVRELVWQNNWQSSAEPGDRRLELESYLYEECGSSENNLEAVLGYLDNFQEVLEDESKLDYWKVCKKLKVLIVWYFIFVFFSKRTT